VKKSQKYYDDASHMLRAIMLRAVAPQYQAHLRFENPLLEASIRVSQQEEPCSSFEEARRLEEELLKEQGREVGGHYVPIGTNKQELRCVLGMIRHGDRTPKQKLKFTTSSPALMSLWHTCHPKQPKKPRKELKLKNVDELKALFSRFFMLFSRSFHAI